MEALVSSVLDPDEHVRKTTKPKPELTKIVETLGISAIPGEVKKWPFNQTIINAVPHRFEFTRNIMNNIVLFIKLIKSK